MDWNLAFSGVKTKTRKFGLVIHGVTKKDLEPANEDNVVLRDELEEENTSRSLTIAEVTPLRRGQKYRNRIAAH